MFKGEDGSWAFRCHAATCGVSGRLELLGAALGVVPGTGRGVSIPSPIERDRDGKETWAPVPLGAGGAGDQVAWVWEGFLGRGLVTDFYGLWKAGKSTLLALLLREMAHGGEMLGRAVMRGRALVVTEESADRWARRCRELSIPEGSHDLIARPFKRRPTREEWERFLDHLAGLVRDRGYALVVFDALPNLWPVLRENEAGEVLDAVRPVVSLLEAGPAVLFVRHPRKADGEEATAGRGSGALAGFADVIVEFRRYRPEDPEDRRRVLSVYSREEPFEVVGELRDGTYVALGGKAQVRREDRLRAALSLLPTEPPGLTAEEVQRAWPGDLQPRLTAVKEILNTLLGRGLVVRTGSGRRGDPYRWLVSIPSRSTSYSDGIEKPGQPETLDEDRPPTCWCCGEAPAVKGGLCQACLDNSDGCGAAPARGPEETAPAPGDRWSVVAEATVVYESLPWPLDLALDVPAREPTDRVALAQAAAALLNPARGVRVSAPAPEERALVVLRRRRLELCEGCGGPVAVLGGRRVCSRCGWRGPVFDPQPQPGSGGTGQLSGNSLSGNSPSGQGLSGNSCPEIHQVVKPHTCRGCGAELPGRRRGRSREWCSEACRKRVTRSRHPDRGSAEGLAPAALPGVAEAAEEVLPR